MNPNKHLDNIIRDALKDLEADYNPRSWRLFEERLNADPAGNELLDGLIAGKLSRMEVAHPDANWSAFEHRLEAEEAAELIEQELEVDSLAYDSLQHYDAPTKESHWPLMAQRLEEEFSLRYKLIKYKVAELALVFLIILTFIRFMPLATEVIDKAKDRNQESGITSTAIYRGQINEQSLGYLRLDYPVSSFTFVQNFIPGYFSTGTGQSILLPPSVQQPAVMFSDNHHRGQLLPVLPWNAAKLRTSEIAQLKNRISDHAVNDNTGKTYDTANQDFKGFNKIDLVKSLEKPELAIAHINGTSVAGNLRFGFFTATDYTYVFSPSESFNLTDTLISTTSEFTGASGYGAGFSVSLKKGKFEFQSGGIYSFKRYVPNTPIFLFKTVKYYVEENFHGIQQDIFQVPLNLRYHYKDQGNWRLYGHVGASMHFITSSVYEIQYKYTPAFINPGATAPGSETQSFLKGKEFPKGLADGGRLKDNLYLTANIGFGVERYVTPNWSLFFQPNYQHYLNSSGIGTNKDRFYTFSVQLGAKVSLK